jgi:hypothetical protein
VLGSCTLPRAVSLGFVSELARSTLMDLPGYRRASDRRAITTPLNELRYPSGAGGVRTSPRRCAQPPHLADHQRGPDSSRVLVSADTDQPVSLIEFQDATSRSSGPRLNG